MSNPSRWHDELLARYGQMTIPQMCEEIERLRAALQHIAHMECFTRDGEEEPHLLMMRLAQEALNA